MRFFFVMLAIFYGQVVQVSLATGEKIEEIGILDVTPVEAAKTIRDKKVMILDIRTKTEFDEGHLPGAKQVDFLNKHFRSKLGALDPEKRYLFYCASGGRSSKAAKIFKLMGFTHVYHLKEGFKSWERASLPVEK